MGVSGLLDERQVDLIGGTRRIEFDGLRHLFHLFDSRRNSAKCLATKHKLYVMSRVDKFVKARFESRFSASYK